MSGQSYAQQSYAQQSNFPPNPFANNNSTSSSASVDKPPMKTVVVEEESAVSTIFIVLFVLVLVSVIVIAVIGISSFNNLVNTTVIKITGVVEDIGELTAFAIKELGKALQDAIEFVDTIVLALADLVSDFVSGLRASIQNMISNISNSLTPYTQTLGVIFQQVGQLLLTWWNGTLSQMFGAIETAIQDVLNILQL